MRSPMRFARFFSVLLFAMLSAGEGAGAPLDWNGDLDTLQRELPKIHPSAFHATSPDAFNAAIAKLRASAPSLPPHVVAAEISKIVATIGDGHTRLTMPIDPNAGFFSGHTSTKIPDDPALHFRHLPVRFAWLSDGMIVTAAANQELIGKRVLRIGTKKIEDAVTAMAPLASADN